MADQRLGYRGYIGTRPLNGSRTPQAVQNLVVRDYAQRNKLQYLLSAVEYAMPNCFLMLNEVLVELPKLEGMICFSLFMLPADAARRRSIYRRVIDSRSALHAALEAQVLRKDEDMQRWEDIWLVQQALASSPTAL
jgi:sporadic carbohydrate cluster protein (TIGR04323 family)